jgi:starch phosphorylase
MRESMVRLTPAFSSNRTLREYVEDYYLPGAAAYLDRAAAGVRLGVQIAQASKLLVQHWSDVQFVSMSTKQQDGLYYFSTELFLGKMPPELVEVQLYADPVLGSLQPFLERMQISGNENSSYRYTCTAPANRPAEDYTPRVIACQAGLAAPLEAPYIRWVR